jgi:DNA adenine methylase
MKPFLKWAGNKYQIIDTILKSLPKNANRLIEPFAGSAAVFINSEYPEAVIADSNADLISVYQHLKAEGRDFIEYCKSFFTEQNNCPEAYYHFRTVFNSTKNAREKAALFLYLNRHGYNGLCRYNQSGAYNVPFGRYKKPYFPNDELFYFVGKCHQAVFKVQDFQKTIEEAEPGDVVYCDPPYVPLNSTACFTTYSAGGFDTACQLRLARLAEETADRGITILISNHNTEFTRKEYQNARLHEFQVRRFISCNGSNRSKAAELLAVFAATQSSWNRKSSQLSLQQV